MLQELNHCTRLQQECAPIVQLIGLSYDSSGAICLVYECADSVTMERVPESIDLHAARCSCMRKLARVCIICTWQASCMLTLNQTTLSYIQPSLESCAL